MFARIARPGLARAALVVALVLMIGPEVAQAQRQQPPPRAELERRLRARFQTLVREQLGMDAEQQRLFNATLRVYQARREQLLLRESQLRRRLRAQGPLNPTDPPPLPSDEEATELLEEMAAIQQDEVLLFEEEKEALLEFLTPGQLVRFYGMREELGQRIRNLAGPGRGGRVGGAAVGWYVRRVAPTA